MLMEMMGGMGPMGPMGMDDEIELDAGPPHSLQQVQGTCYTVQFRITLHNFCRKGGEVT